MNEIRSGHSEESSSTDRSTVEELCQEFMQAWQENAAPSLEQFLARVPEHQRARLLRALLVIEVRFRCRNGDIPHRRDYTSRFPEERGLIKEVFQLVPKQIRTATDEKPQS